MFCAFCRKIDKYRKAHIHNNNKQTNKNTLSWYQQNYRIKRTQEGQPDSGPTDANHRLCKPQNKLPDGLKKKSQPPASPPTQHALVQGLRDCQPKKRFHLGNRANTWKMSINIDQEKDYAKLVPSVGEITLGEKTRKSMWNSQLRRREALSYSAEFWRGHGKGSQ